MWCETTKRPRELCTSQGFQKSLLRRQWGVIKCYLHPQSSYNTLKSNLERESSLKLHLKGCAFPAREDTWLQYVILLDRTAAGFDRQYLSRAAGLSLYRAAASRHKATRGSGTCRHPSIHPSLPAPLLRAGGEGGTHTASCFPGGRQQ